MKKRYWLKGGILFSILYLIYIVNHLDTAQKSPGEDYFFFLFPLSFVLGSLAGVAYEKFKATKGSI
jgi:hypothetical protein